MQKMNKKEILIALILGKGKCNMIFTNSVCNYCPLTYHPCLYSESIYKRAINLYLELYGKESLVEVLI